MTSSTGRYKDVRQKPHAGDDGCSQLTRLQFRFFIFFLLPFLNIWVWHMVGTQRWPEPHPSYWRERPFTCLELPRWPLSPMVLSRGHLSSTQSHWHGFIKLATAWYSHVPWDGWEAPNLSVIPKSFSAFPGSALFRRYTTLPRFALASWMLTLFLVPTPPS